MPIRFNRDLFRQLVRSGLDRALGWRKERQDRRRAQAEAAHRSAETLRAVEAWGEGVRWYRCPECGQLEDFEDGGRVRCKVEGGRVVRVVCGGCADFEDLNGDEG